MGSQSSVGSSSTGGSTGGGLSDSAGSSSSGSSGGSTSPSRGSSDGSSASRGGGGADSGRSGGADFSRSVADARGAGGTGGTDNGRSNRSGDDDRSSSGVSDNDNRSSGAGSRSADPSDLDGPGSYFGDFAAMAGASLPDGAPQVEGDQENDDQANPAVVGRAAAAGRDAYVDAQTRQVTDAVNNAPITAYSDDVYRSVDTPYASTYNNAMFSSPGRYNRTGETTLYTSETMHGIEVEAARYPGDTDPSGLAGKTVTRSEFTGDVIDATNLPNVTEGALTEGYGKNGQERGALSRLTGEDPYTHTRALSDAARARGVEGVRVPAGEGAVHVGVMPGNMTDTAAQFQYRDHANFDASGVPGPVQSTPGSITPPPDASTPSIYDPASTHYDPAKTETVRTNDVAAHNRAGGVRYGAAGGGLAAGGNALYDRVVNGDALDAADARDVAIGTGTGAAAAYADDLLTPGIGSVRAGGVVDGVISAGTSVYSNAQAYERGDISAADATADVVVDTGVGVASGLAGAAAGAAIGSVVPVAGTAVGAAIGFGVGMLVSWGASTALEETGAADWAREGLGDVLEDNVNDGVLEGAWNKISGWFGG